ncbi:hypothetical protein [Nitrospira sp. Nam74]
MSIRPCAFLDSRGYRLCPLFIIFLCIGALLCERAAKAEDRDDCRFICTPLLSVFPSVVLQELFVQPRVRSLITGMEQTLNPTAHFGTIFNLQVPTTLPRVSLVGRVVIVSFADSDTNPFTGYTAKDLGIQSIDENAPILEYGVGLDLLNKQETKQWLDLQLNILALFAPAFQPGDSRAYHHQFGPDLLATFHIFHWLPKDNWFRNVNFYMLLKYQATGLPRAGDVVPKDQLLWLNNASPLELWIGFGFPIAPLFPP